MTADQRTESRLLRLAVPDRLSPVAACENLPRFDRAVMVAAGIASIVAVPAGSSGVDSGDGPVRIVRYGHKEDRACNTNLPPLQETLAPLVYPP